MKIITYKISYRILFKKNEWKEFFVDAENASDAMKAFEYFIKFNGIKIRDISNNIQVFSAKEI